jgi:hypothetical protein
MSAMRVRFDARLGEWQVLPSWSSAASGRLRGLLRQLEFVGEVVARGLEALLLFGS